MDTTSDIPKTSSPNTEPHHDRVVMPSYLSDTNRQELVAAGIKMNDLSRCWSAHFNKRATKGKCKACGLAVRIPSYLIKIMRLRYHKDPDRPHAMFIYVNSVEEMEKINPQRVQKRTTLRNHRRHIDEEDDDYEEMRNEPVTSCKAQATVSDDVDLILQMEVLGSSWEESQSAKRASMLIPVCFECYLAAKAVTDPMGYRITSFRSIPDLDTKLQSMAHGNYDDLSPVNKGIVTLDQLRQRLAWCTLPGSRHCIHVTDKGVGGYKVCAKRRDPIIKAHLHDGKPTYNDYCCLAHRSTDREATIQPPVEYIGMFAYLDMY